MAVCPRRGDQDAMKPTVALTLVLLLAACSSAPPPPDWKMNAVSLIEHFQASWLEGDGKTADMALDKARGEIAKTGRLDLLARAELAACATRAAGLDFSPCVGYGRLAGEAAANDAAYARFIAGEWRGIDTKALPAHYASLATAKDDAAANRAVGEIKEPLPRLIAAALLFKTQRAEPATLAVAVATASERGWRRPLLAWLNVQLKRAQAAADMSAAAHLQRRIDLITGPSLPASQ
ncbi:MAG: hypothetical protein COW48_03880 [Hydrogenophilales bacterium CG17_big_fil_post_rev_8_21_14_2_50_63_12]|nr:MAG: hypothetical protein COW48_03880 [Hydrogenophilales bacterium CG17_big_fil_post_rev_8_21_14_2_50_63_12]PIX96502.1 MAG: hypothetical protein COZ24_10155 [Hydrogenophilales bacterium CG_4_10_14_3_um_filter_63_21]PJB02404.1 MAG: hypothetical protein CO126_11945 [Hydrogenophilales bacterium CG_4_9_14_3_um_filter_63_34]